MYPDNEHNAPGSRAGNNPATEDSTGTIGNDEADDCQEEGTGAGNMRKWNLALTYQPKIEAVRSGICRQTIRPVGKSPGKAEGDLISFHGWADRPYRSPWSWRTPYVPLTETKRIAISPEGIWITKPCRAISHCYHWIELDNLALFDGIVPPTGEALRDVLMSKNKIPEEGIRAQILRW